MDEHRVNHDLDVLKIEMSKLHEEKYKETILRKITERIDTIKNTLRNKEDLYLKEISAAEKILNNIYRMKQRGHLEDHYISRLEEEERVIDLKAREIAVEMNHLSKMMEELTVELEKVSHQTEKLSEESAHEWAHYLHERGIRGLVTPTYVRSRD